MKLLSWRAVLNLGEGQNDGIILSVGIRSDLLALRGARDEACGDSDADQHAGAAGCFPARCATRVDPARGFCARINLRNAWPRNLAAFEITNLVRCSPELTREIYKLFLPCGWLLAFAIMQNGSESKHPFALLVFVFMNV